MDMEQLSLFDTEHVYDPLASRMRPENLDEFAGQTNLLGKGKLLRQLIEQDRIPSMIFWGPPGVGKTTLAGIIAKRTHAEFVNFSAVTSGIKEIREVMAQAESRRRMGRKNRALCRRDPPFQQGAAGCLSSFCGEGKHYPDRRDHRKSFL